MGTQLERHRSSFPVVYARLSCVFTTVPQCRICYGKSCAGNQKRMYMLHMLSSRTLAVLQQPSAQSRTLIAAAACMTRVILVNALSATALLLAVSTVSLTPSQTARSLACQQCIQVANATPPLLHPDMLLRPWPAISTPCILPQHMLHAHGRLHAGWCSQ